MSRVTSGELQRQAVDDHIVRPRNAHRIVRRRRVEVGARRQPRFGQLIFPPAASSGDPVSRLHLFRARGDRRLDVPDRSDVRQIDLGLQVLAGGQVDVRVVEARKHSLAVQVDDPRLRTLGLEHIDVASDADEPAVAYGRGGGRGKLRIDRDDMRVADDEIGRRARSGGGTQQKQYWSHFWFPRLDAEADSGAEEPADDVVKLSVGAAFVDPAGRAGRDHRRIGVEQIVDDPEQLNRALAG